MGMASTKNGYIVVKDFRCIESEPLLEFRAHRKICGIDFNQFIPGLLATCGGENNVRLWDISTYQPLLLAEENLNIGTCFTLAVAPSQPYLLAAGGSSEQISVWDIRSSRIFNSNASLR